MKPKTPATSLLLLPFLLLLPHHTLQIPLPSDSPPSSTLTASSSEPDFSPPPLIILPDNDDHQTTDDNEDSSKQKRHESTPSPSELESRRAAFIKSLGGGEDSAPVLLSSLQGLGSLATDVVSLLGSNANETFAPLREARQRARSNFPNIGTQINTALSNGREYSVRAYRSLLKNLRVKTTNALRFALQAVTRLASTVGGLYQVMISLLDVATRGVGAGARVGARLLSAGSNLTIIGLARGTQAVRNLADSGLLVKPVNQAVMVGREVAKGITEDLFDKVEWAQEGLTSKLELAQALAPNFLLRAHENNRHQPPSIPDSDPYGGSSDGGYSNGADDSHSLLSLASAAVELMQRDGREVDKVMSMMMVKNHTETTTTTEEPSSPPSTTTTPTIMMSSQDKMDDSMLAVNQTLLNDIFGLEGGEEGDKLKGEDMKKS